MNTDDQNKEQTDHAVQTYLKSALEHTISAGRSVRDFSEFALEKFGDDVLPELRTFFENVRHERVKIKGLARAAKKRIIGLHVSPQEREGMIRLAAYIRAERRGFVGGSPEQDWYEATKEIDAKLEKEAGLIKQGRNTLKSATTTVEEEYAHVKHIVSDWLAEKFGETEKSTRKQTAPKAKAQTSTKKPKTIPKTAKKKTTAKRASPATLTKKKTGSKKPTKASAKATAKQPASAKTNSTRKKALKKPVQRA